MEFKDRLRIAIENKGVTPYMIGRDTKVSKVSVGNYLKGTIPGIGNISILADYLGVNVKWLIEGEGEMLKSPNIIVNSNQGNGNIIGNNNRGNVGMGNVVHVSLPETGTQKIIKPSGEVRVTAAESNASTSDELKDLKTEIQHLNAMIAMKDDLIANLKTSMTIKDDLITSLKETIEILKSRQ